MFEGGEAQDTVYVTAAGEKKVKTRSRAGMIREARGEPETHSRPKNKGGEFSWEESQQF